MHVVRLSLILCAALSASLAASGPLHAQALVKPDGQFRATLGLGASVSSGNTSSSELSFTGDGVRATDQGKTSIYGNAQLSRAEGVTTQEQARLGARQDHNLNSVWFAFGGLDFERNEFANLKLRSQVSGGLGWHVLKEPDVTWDLFGGLGYTQDRYSLPTLVDDQLRSRYSYPGLLLRQESTHKLTPSTSAKQRLTFVPNLKNTGEYRANWDAGLAVAMTRAMSLNVGLSVAHNSDPGPGRKTTDTLLTTGISVKFE